MVVEKLPYPARVNGQSVLMLRGYEDRTEYIKTHPEVDPLTVCLVALAMFHTKRDREYIAASYIDDRGDEHWTRDFGKKELLLWMGGVALDASDQRILHLANRNHGDFAQHYGWRPDSIVEWEPNELEEEAYILHELQDLDDSDGMPIDFFKGNA